MVLARCQLELSRLEDATETLTLIMEKAEESQMWPWFLMAEGTRARINITKGQVPQMMEIIKQQRDRVAKLKSPNELSWLINRNFCMLCSFKESTLTPQCKSCNAGEVVRSVDGVTFTHQGTGRFERTGNFIRLVVQKVD